MTEKTRQAPLTIPQKFDLMSAVKQRMASAELTDTEFAAVMSGELKRPIHPSTVTLYREAFGIPQYKAPSAAELRAQVRKLQRELELRDGP